MYAQTFAGGEEAGDDDDYKDDNSDDGHNEPAGHYVEDQYYEYAEGGGEGDPEGGYDPRDGAGRTKDPGTSTPATQSEGSGGEHDEL